MTYEEMALRGDFDQQFVTHDQALEEARVSDLGGYLFMNWPGKEIGYMPSCENIYHIARVVVRGGWRKA